MVVLKYILFILLWGGSLSAFAQKEQLPDATGPLNRLDGEGKRTGSWWINHKAGMGESAYAEFGNYNDGKKYGKWYKIDHMGEITSVETFNRDKLDGDVRYYNKGILYCSGSYRTFRPGDERDTVMVVNPETDEQMLREVIHESNSTRHGIWRFYDESNGKLLKEEEYQVDSLIWSKAYTSPQDSIAAVKYKEKLPHNSKRYRKERSNPKGQVLN